MAGIDWVIVGAYVLFALGIGAWFSRRAGKNLDQYFLSGRTLPWWVVGTSMVATTFAADTPLAITEWVRTDGIWQNWFWWSSLLSGMVGVMLFSRLWRRSRVLTDNELLEIRYSGRPAAFLRCFKAGYFALLYNFIVMGWVINGMSTVLAIVLGTDRWTAVWCCVAIALLYALLSGFWGVVITDLIQFVIAMVGSILLAVIATREMGGMGEILSGIRDIADASTNEPGTPSSDLLSFIPPLPDSGPLTRSFWESPFSKFMIFITIMWWSGHGTDGGGYIIQRMSSARNEKHALLGTLWYNFANYALRVWPWVVVGMVSLLVFPDIRAALGPELANELGEKAGYPLVMDRFLGPGMMGLLVVSFLAAFMSTIDTHLNWGTSYLINDVYKRFLRPESTFESTKDAQRHYIVMSRIFTFFLMVAAALVAVKMQSISKAWEFVAAMGAGIGLVLILRWFWWRVNAWTEIAALTTSLVLTVGFECIAAVQTVGAGDKYQLFGRAPEIMGMPLAFHHKLLVIVPVSILTWLLVTFLTKPEPREHLLAFYTRVQPGGWWGTISGEVERTMPDVTRGFLLNWLAGIVFVWGANFAIGMMVFGRWGTGLALAGASVVGFAWIWRTTISKLDDLPSPGTGA